MKSIRAASLTTIVAASLGVLSCSPAEAPVLMQAPPPSPSEPMPSTEQPVPATPPVASISSVDPAVVERRANEILARMTLEEKVDYIGGVDGFYVRAVERLRLPALKMADGPVGVRNWGPSTAYAAGIALAAAWDPELAYRVGAMIGRDARARGVHFLLGPGVNLYRSPMCGRNFEYFGEDPYLASRTVVAYINGVQSQGVAATVKHYAGNNSEVDRYNTSSDIGERALRELYLQSFEAAVREAHVGAVMTAYNLVNGVHMSQNGRLNNEILKQEWGFDGVVMSDWTSTYDGVAAANGGLDLEMPSGKFMNRKVLLPAVAKGQVSIATIDDKVRRILRTAIRFGWLDRDQTDHEASLFSWEGREVALQSARSSMVLLKNDAQLLPLSKSKIRSIAVIGPDAYPAVPAGGGSAQVRPFAPVSYLEGLVDYLADGVAVQYSRGLVGLSEIFESTDFMTAARDGESGLAGEYFDNSNLRGQPRLRRVDRHIDFSRDQIWPTGAGEQAGARWTGYYVPKSSGEFRFATFGYRLNDCRLYVDGVLLVDRAKERSSISTKTLTLEANRPYKIRFEYVRRDHHHGVGLGVRKADAFIDPVARELAAKADAAIVLAGFDPTTEAEGYDRSFQLPLGQDELIEMVRQANPNTVVAITAGGSVDMTRWVGQVGAVVQTWYPGQEGGKALAELLFGEYSPSGKLPISFERRWEDNAAYNSYYPNSENHIEYTEGVLLGYRHFDKASVAPLFPFGHGLSYTTFAFGDLRISPDSVSAEGSVKVSFDVSNVGARAGAEVAQVYVRDVDASVPRPVKELKGFAKVQLASGETRRIEITLDHRALSYFDVGAHGWRAEPGEFEVLVGSSSREIALRGKLALE